MARARAVAPGGVSGLRQTPLVNPWCRESHVGTFDENKSETTSGSVHASRSGPMSGSSWEHRAGRLEWT